MQKVEGSSPFSRFIEPPDFRGFGASGRVYDRTSIVEALSSSRGAAAKASDFQAVRLGARLRRSALDASPPWPSGD
jgi:hypothetical protein